MTGAAPNLVTELSRVLTSSWGEQRGVYGRKTTRNQSQPDSQGKAWCRQDCRKIMDVARWFQKGTNYSYRSEGGKLLGSQARMTFKMCHVDQIGIRLMEHSHINKGSKKTTFRWGLIGLLYSGLA